MRPKYRVSESRASLRPDFTEDIPRETPGEGNAHVKWPFERTILFFFFFFLRVYRDRAVAREKSKKQSISGSEKKISLLGWKLVAKRCSGISFFAVARSNGDGPFLLPQLGYWFSLLHLFRYLSKVSR